MQNDANFVDAYKERLRIPSHVELNPTIENLQKLVESHLRYIPFENLSLHIKGELQDPIVLTRDQLIHKILKKKRGGCCLELNGLFAMLLQELGYDVIFVPCWVYAGSGRGHKSNRRKFRTSQSHFFLLVRNLESKTITGNNQFCLTNQFIVDVGFGEPALGPLCYGSDWINQQQETPDGMKSRLVRDPQGSFTDRQGRQRRCLLLEWLRIKGGGEDRHEWEPRLQWDEAEAPLIPSEHGTATLSLERFRNIIPILMDPKSTFMRKNISCVVTRDVKTSLSGRRLKVTSSRFDGQAKVHVQDVSSDEEFAQVLKNKFGIALQDGEVLDLEKSDKYAGEDLWGRL